jgi:hypothetical protein
VRKHRPFPIGDNKARTVIEAKFKLGEVAL